ncbi:hypothetical protein [Solimonas sp. SE-A11]|uniref:hypothetical protein n=1 Tax=Solimonas sp. SE-A11 TaxID=3054954 RepID=UPI00259D170C|nr:hypothetical protein [Solimonas sp. SE-A11]MDM4769041.1 hypothetical protein [Solimonas sp. SE-A11]
MDYFGNRQNPLSGSDEERDAAFRALHEHFQSDWLQARGDHLLQRLWRRRDALATFELYTLGYSLARLDPIDKSWLKHQVKIVKGRDENNTNGALFEILGVSSLLNGNQSVVPAKQNQKGYDVDVVDTDNHSWRISLKTYSPSIHERGVQKRMKIAREKVRSLLAQKVHSVRTIVLATAFPTEADWQVLLTTIADACSQFRGQAIVLERGCWVLTLATMKPMGEQSLSPYHLSDHFIGTVPFHSNEHLNILSKLQEAASKLATNKRGRSKLLQPRR